MHRLWEIQDVVEEILYQCSASAVSALGRTCHALFPIAMDVLWGDFSVEVTSLLLPLGGPWRCVEALPGSQEPLPPEHLNQLILVEQRTIPRKLKRAVGAFFGRRAPYPQKEARKHDPCRFEFYAKRVKALNLYDDIRDQMMWMDTLTILRVSLSSGTSAFSRLRVLGIQVSSPNTLLTVASYPWPDLECVGLRIQSTAFLPEPSVRLWDGFIKPALMLPRLDHLTMMGHEWADGDSTAFLQAVCSARPHLSMLLLSGVVFNADMFHKTPGFQNIRSLQLTFGTWNLNGCILDSPCLVKLELICQDVDLRLVHFMQNLNAPVLAKLIVSCGVYTVHPPLPRLGDDAAQELIALLVNRHTSLRFLHLYEGIAFRTLPLEPRSFEMLTPLLSLPLIEVVFVSETMGLSVTDDDIDTITRSWTEIQRLILHGRVDHDLPSERTTVTSHGLNMLSSRCLKLRSLGLRLTLPDSMSQMDAMPRANAQSALIELDVFSSQPGDPFATTALIKRAFPKLQHFLYDGEGTLIEDIWDLPQYHLQFIYADDNSEKRRRECMAYIQAAVDIQTNRWTGFSYP
ncbi:hypothetical protein CALVIDRAFT_537409 [Calocera viscosa TUFC12733]|uniref:Uncharacterized protein n=1 Tax=Calocera viscosa (strain TUFC12733) TaxID=1330018 RepID=A0A167M0K5_CALVF|nr:hypothetical protein CALVIDRAFT_537409 [Calocera viscosa TUFC12733]